MTDGCKDRQTLPEQELDGVAGGSGSVKYRAECETCGWCSDTFESKSQADSKAMDHNMANQFTHDVHVVYSTY